MEEDEGHMWKMYLGSPFKGKTQINLSHVALILFRTAVFEVMVKV